MAVNSTRRLTDVPSALLLNISADLSKLRERNFDKSADIWAEIMRRRKPDSRTLNTTIRRRPKFDAITPDAKIMLRPKSYAITIMRRPGSCAIIPTRQS